MLCNFTRLTFSQVLTSGTCVQTGILQKISEKFPCGIAAFLAYLSFISRI